MTDTRIIYGFHAVASRLRQSAASVNEIYLEATREDRRANELLKAAESRGARVMRVDEKRLDGLTHHARHQGVAARIELAKLPTHVEDVLEALEEPPLLLILDGVTDLSAPIPTLNSLPFISGADVSIPSSPRGTIHLTLTPRGGGGQVETLNVPNWPSSGHTVSLVFTDWPVDGAA